MSQTILIENNIDHKKLFTQSLETFVGTEVIHRPSADEAINLLKILPGVSLIITRARIETEETALKLYNYISENALNVPMLILGDCPDLRDEVHCLKGPINVDQLIHQATEHLELGMDAEVISNSNDFVPFGLHCFYDLPKAPCDVFIRIKKSNTQFKFYKRINAHETFDRWALHRYHDNGLKEFYVQKEDKHQVVQFIVDELTHRLNRQDLGNEELILTISNVHRMVREIVQKSGMNEAAIKLSEASIQSIVTSVIYSPEISNLLKIILTGRIPYAYKVCHLQALMCHYILSKQNWYKAKHLETLSFVAYFADISLQDEEQMQIGSMDELYATTLSDFEKTLVMEHARRSLLTVEKHPMMNSYIKTIMLESHGKGDGFGIEADPAEGLHVLSKIFIVADHFVKILLNPELPSTKKEILPILYERFSHPSYQKIIKTLEQRFQ